MAGELSRRGLLLGAGAMAVAGCAGQGGGSGPAPSGSAPSGPASAGAAKAAPADASGWLDSRFTRARMGWRIRVPEGQRPVAIVYCLHGMGGDHRMAFGIGVPEAAASIGLPVAVAAVDGGADSYWHRRADGTDAMAMLLREFVPMVRERVGALPQAVMGWSMGGYGALLAAERAPGEFGAVSPASPALWLTPGATAPGAFDGAADYRAHDVFSRLGRLAAMRPAVFCGKGDPFYAATRHLVSLMDFPHLARFGPGGHNYGYWSGVAASQLRAMGAVLGVSG